MMIGVRYELSRKEKVRFSSTDSHRGAGDDAEVKKTIIGETGQAGEFRSGQIFVAINNDVFAFVCALGLVAETTEIEPDSCDRVVGAAFGAAICLIAVNVQIIELSAEVAGDVDRSCVFFDQDSPEDIAIVGDHGD